MMKIFLCWSVGRVKSFIFSFFFIKINAPSLLLEFLFHSLLSCVNFRNIESRAIKILKMAFVITVKLVANGRISNYTRPEDHEVHRDFIAWKTLN